jgi:hypothetical protein
MFYRLRWSIESLFRALKGVGRLDEIQSANPAIIKAFIAATLIGLVLSQTICAIMRAQRPRCDPSLLRVFALVLANLGRLAAASREAVCARTTHQHRRRVGVTRSLMGTKGILRASEQYTLSPSGGLGHLIHRAGAVGAQALLLWAAIREPTNWGVDPALRAADEKAGLIINGSYIKNPTAKDLKGLITETGKIGSKRVSGQFQYVVDAKTGRIVIGTRGGARMPHPTLLGGPNPTVKAAGIVDIRGGRIYSIDNASGHFKPGDNSLEAAKKAFGTLPKGAFHKDFKGYVRFDRK